MSDMLAALRLAQERRFAEAAALALEAAERALQSGFRKHAFDDYGAAGKFFHLAGQPAAALEAFERAFEIFEQDLIHQPRANMVIRRLASWPELYARAALSGLEVGEPRRAVNLAERGRSRAISHRIGPGADASPPGTDPALWERYVHAWRAAVALAANGVVSDQDWARRADAKKLDRELGDLRTELRRAGVPAEKLSPVVTPARVEDVERALTAPGAPAAVVAYALGLDDSILRLVSISRAGCAEIPLEDADQSRILGACRQHWDSLRADPAGAVGRMPDLLDALLAEAGPALGAALGQALRSAGASQLLWIPQGALVNVPVMACPLDGQLLADQAAVTLAPSLTAALQSLAVETVTRPRALAVRGRADSGSAPTGGGQPLTRLVDPDSPPETVPSSAEQLALGARGRSLVMLSCHGCYDWDDPLQSYLMLGEGFDLRLEQAFGASLFDPGALVLLGTCDSATVAQSEINEAIGVPLALQGAGARTVIGATWPIASVAAAALCLRLLKELAAGATSPRALQRASCWLRDVGGQGLCAELAAVGHPLAPDLAKVLAADAAAVDFSHPVYWAAYQHWGACWQLRA